MKEINDILESHGVRVTPNRILVLRALVDSANPLTMSELEDCIGTMDKSSIFRALVVFREHHLVHCIEACDEGTRYEVCRSEDCEEDTDEHVHFHCTICHRTFCFEDIPVPSVVLPEGFRRESANYVVSGICPECRGKVR